MRKITNGKLSLVVSVLLITSTSLFAQSLISIDPDSTQRGQSLGVAVTGQDTHFNQATSTSIWFSQGSAIIDAYSYFPVNDTYMTVWFDIPGDSTTGLHDLNVYNEIDGTLTLDDSFTIDSGDLVSVNPNTAQQGQSLAILFTSQDTNFSQASPATVLVFAYGSSTGSQGSTTATWWLSDTLLSSKIYIPSDAPVGQVDIGLVNDIDGTLMLYNGFTITPYEPVLTTVTPSAAYKGQKLSVSVTGQNTNFWHQGTTTAFSQGSPTTWFATGSEFIDNATTVVWLSQGSSTIFSTDCGIAGDELLMASFEIPADASTGLWDVNVPKSEGILTLPEAFLISWPGDMTCDGMVNMPDLAVLAGYWLEGTEP